MRMIVKRTWPIGCVSCLTLLVGVNLAVAAVPTNDLVLYLSFEEQAGTATFTDSSGSGNHATCSGPSCPTAGVSGPLGFGKAAHFDDVDDHLIVNASSFLNAGNSLTLAAWYRAEDTSQNPILEWRPSDASSSGVHMWTGVTGFQWHNFPGSGGSGANFVDTNGDEVSHVISTPDPNINQWHHLATTYDDDTGIGKVYLDGQLANQRDIGQFVPQTSFDLYVGLRAPMSQFFDGSIDEVRVYNRALSASEVTSLVPEPTSLCLILGGCLRLLCRRTVRLAK